MGNTPFKLKGWSPFTKTSPAKTTHPGEEPVVETYVTDTETDVGPVTSDALAKADANLAAHGKINKTGWSDAKLKVWDDKRKVLGANRDRIFETEVKNR